MTLQQWIDAGPTQGQPVSATDESTRILRHGPVIPGYGYVLADGVREDRAQLWTLEDYRVVAVTGGSVWLSPR